MRRDDLVVVGSAEDVVRVLALEFENTDPIVRSLAMELFHAGLSVAVWIVDARVPKARVDLRPFVKATAPDVFEVDVAGVRAVLPPLGGEVITAGKTLDFEIDGLQAKELDAEFLYFADRPVRWGHRDLEGGAATPHLKRAFPRASRARRKA